MLFPLFQKQCFIRWAWIYLLAPNKFKENMKTLLNKIYHTLQFYFKIQSEGHKLVIKWLCASMVFYYYINISLYRPRSKRYIISLSLTNMFSPFVVNYALSFRFMWLHSLLASTEDNIIMGNIQECLPYARHYLDNFTRLASIACTRSL